MVEIYTNEPIEKPVKKAKKNSKLFACFWAVAYASLTIGLCLSGTWAFTKFYYYPIYVSGPSMEPTLNGGTRTDDGRFDFGYIDTHQIVIDSINRFDIVTTFYPFASEDYTQPFVKGNESLETAKRKIKRVIGLPGDTLTIRKNSLYLLDKETNTETLCELPFDVWNSDTPGYERFNVVDFKTKGYGDENGWLTLAEDEYWVMGDNWIGSRDCYSDTRGGPIYKENIVGVLIAIVGTCLVKNETIYDKQYTLPRFFK